MLRIPNLSDARNEVVQWAGIAVAVLTIIVGVLEEADLSTLDGVVAAVALLLSNMASTQVWSARSVAELSAETENIVD